MNYAELTLHDSELNDLRVTGLCKLINHFQCKRAIEIGVREASLSAKFLQYSNLEELIGLDILDCKLAHKLAKENSKYKFYQGSSPNYASHFEDNSFDFIHLDADHHYEAVKAELPVWYKKLKIGGIYSGDDYMKYFDWWGGEGEFGVWKAVNEFCTEHQIQFYLIGCAETDINKLTEFGAEQGRKLSLFRCGTGPGAYVPNWWLIKEKEL